TSAATATTPATTSANGPLHGAAGDRPHALQGQGQDPREALLGGTHPPRELATSRPRDRPVPEGRQGQARRLQGQPGRRTALVNYDTRIERGAVGAPLSFLSTEPVSDTCPCQGLGVTTSRQVMPTPS